MLAKIQLILIGILLAITVPAHVLIYHGHVTETRSGDGDDHSRDRLYAYLIVDTEFPDDSSGKYNTTLITYRINGDSKEIHDWQNLDNEWTYLENIEAVDRNSPILAIAGRQAYESDPTHFSTLLLQGRYSANVFLYQDEGNSVRDYAVRVIKGTGQSRRLNDADQLTTTTQSFFFRLHGYTRQVNTTGTAGDYTTAVRYVFDRLDLALPPPN